MALAAIETATQGGFLLNIVSYNVNRIIWEHGTALLFTLVANIFFIAIACVGLSGAIRKIAAQDHGIREKVRNNLALAIVVLALAFKTLMLPAILKSGASDNYLIDWFTQICVLIGLASIPLLRGALGLPAQVSMLLCALFAIGLPIQFLGSPIWADRAAAAVQQRQFDTIVASIRHSRGPVITDDATLLLRADKPMRWEPAIVAELASFGRYDERRFIDMIRRREFGFFVTAGDSGDLLFDQRFNPATAEAIHAAYPRRVHIGGRTLHFPSAPTGAP